MTTLIYGFTSLNVADGNSLKEINGALLNDADMALGIYNSQKCFYQLDESSGATESLPDIVSPSLNAGTKRWILRACLVADITANGLTASKAVFTDANKKLVSIGTLGADQGGTGASTLTDHGVLLGSGTDPITALGAMTNGQLVIGSTGNDPVVASITDGEGIDTTGGAGTLTIACEDASTSNKGVTVYSGTTKALAGTDTASAMTPADVRTVMADYAATEVQAAINELDTEKLAKASNLSDVASAATAFANIKQAATTSTSGVTVYSGSTKALAGTDTASAMTPADVRTAMANYATAAEITAGTEPAKAIAPDQLKLSSPTFANITDSGLTASQMVCTDADKKLVSKPFTFTRGGTLVNTVDYVAAMNVGVWYATCACTVTNVRGYRVGGDSSVAINARRNGSATKHLNTDQTLANADTWYDGGNVQDITYAVGDKLEIMVTVASGNPTQVAIQVDFVKI